MVDNFDRFQCFVSRRVRASSTPKLLTMWAWLEFADSGTACLSTNSNLDANRPAGFHSHLDWVQRRYCTASRTEELKTFRCDHDRKMPLSGLDQSMLIGFLCHQADWLDVSRFYTARSSFVAKPWLIAMYPESTFRLFPTPSPALTLSPPPFKLQASSPISNKIPLDAQTTSCSNMVQIVTARPPHCFVLISRSSYFHTERLGSPTNLHSQEPASTCPPSSFILALKRLPTSRTIRMIRHP